MTQGDWGIVLAILGVILTVVLGLPALERRRVAPHWSSPEWTVGATKVRTHRIPMLTVRWSVRGANALQGVECSIRSPSGTWQRCSSPKGQVQLPKDNLYTHVNLLNGTPFSTTVSSPADIGKPVVDLTAGAVRGKYKLRIVWFEPDKPSRRRKKTFAHRVR